MTQPQQPPGKYYEDLEVGLVIRHYLTRTMTESDNMLFCGMTMNPQPLHIDAEYARASEFGQPLVNSMFTLSLLVGIGVHDLTLGTLVANLGFSEVAFPSPVFHGDTMRAETEVLAKRESKSRPTQGIVSFQHRAYNQRGELIARCNRTALMQKRPV